MERLAKVKEDLSSTREKNMATQAEVENERVARNVSLVNVEHTAVFPRETAADLASRLRKQSRQDLKPISIDCQKTPRISLSENNSPKLSL